VELRHLKYFVAVAEELHFRRAAERLYVAQPAVSEQIRKLEAELGVRLFDRTHRSVALTEPGRTLVAEARRLLHLADAAQHLVRSVRASGGARLRLGYVQDALPAYFPHALQHMASATSPIEVALEAGPALALIAAVRDRRLDAAAVGLPAPTKDLTLTPLGEQPLIAAVPAAHPHSRDEEATLSELAPERLVMLPRNANPALYDAVVAACRQARLTPTFADAAEPRVEAVLLGVAAGAGVALLPESVAARYTTAGVRLVPLADAEPAYEAAVVTLPEAENLATQTLFRALSLARPRPGELRLAA
jgi:DNA-binding transcriptional LysR family regulator